ncbi:hypothetical protein Tco_0994242 [Tanacetum coccineum]
MSDLGRERIAFFTTSKVWRYHHRKSRDLCHFGFGPSVTPLSVFTLKYPLALRIMCPHDDAFLPVPRFPLLGNSSGDYQSVDASMPIFTALSWRQLAFWIRSNGTLHGFLDFFRIHRHKVGVPLPL